jgi:hypothetical protein
MPCLKRAIEQDAIDWIEHDGYRIVQRLRAAAMGFADDEQIMRLPADAPLPGEPAPGEFVSPRSTSTSASMPVSGVAS